MRAECAICDLVYVGISPFSCIPCLGWVYLLEGILTQHKTYLYHAYIVEPKLYSYSLFIHLECNTKERTTALRFCLCQTGHSAWFGLCPVPGLRGSLPYIGYIGMCGAKGYGFLAILVSEIGYQF